MHMYGKRILASIMAAVALNAGAADGVFNESGDAGATLATAQTLTAGRDEIRGALQTKYDVDLYRFTMNQAFSVQARGLDENHLVRAGLILFDQNGKPIGGSEEQASPPAQALFSALPAGTYYLAIADSSFHAYSTQGQICRSDEADCTGSAAPLDTFNVYGNGTGDYYIQFSVTTVATPDGGSAASAIAAVPGPAGLLLLPLLAAVGLAGSRALQRRRA